MTQQLGISPQAKALRDAVNSGEFRGITSWLLTGTRSGATGFGKFSANNKVDIFKEAVNADASFVQGDSPFNTWLDEAQRPLYTVHAKHLGIYLGANLSDNTVQFKRMFLERAILRLKSQRGLHTKQSALTLASGFDLGGQQTDSGVYLEQHGPPSPHALFRLPDETIFAETSDKLNLELEIPKTLTTVLTSGAGAFTGSFPDEGAVITVIIYGDAEYKIGSRAG